MLVVILWRIWSVAVGIVMIALSLIMQMLIFLLLAGIVVAMLLPKVDPGITFVALFLLFNGVSFYEYFRKRKVVTVRGKLNAMKVVLHPDSEHVSMAFFLVPRGIDRILTGKDLTMFNK